MTDAVEGSDDTLTDAAVSSDGDFENEFGRFIVAFAEQIDEREAEAPEGPNLSATYGGARRRMAAHGGARWRATALGERWRTTAHGTHIGARRLTLVHGGARRGRRPRHARAAGTARAASTGERRWRLRACTASALPKRNELAVVVEERPRATRPSCARITSRA